MLAAWSMTAMLSKVWELTWPQLSPVTIAFAPWRRASIPVLRPLIGFNKEEIVNLARAIGTFPVSIQPDQDCCSLFVPRHPETHARPELVSKMEDGLPVEELVQAAIDGTEIREFSSPESVG